MNKLEDIKSHVIHWMGYEQTLCQVYVMDWFPSASVGTLEYKK